MVDHIVIRYVSEKIILSEKLNESGVSFNYGAEQLQSELRNWIIVLQDNFELREEILNQ